MEDREQYRVVICGGAGGLGQATAKEFLKLGRHVFLLDANKDTARIATKLHPTNCTGLSVDLADWTLTQSAFNTARQGTTSLRVLVNAQGWDRPTPFLDTNQGDWKRLIGINLESVIHSCHAFLKAIAGNPGWIVNVSSDAGRIGTKGEAIYSACKAGVIGFTKTLAREAAKDGVLVNCIAPGPIDTPLFSAISRDNPTLISKMVKTIPLQRIGKPEEVAKAIYFFASESNTYITGQVLSVSGGLTMVG